MGWWQVGDIKSGGISTPNNDDPSPIYNGDGPADIMAVALDRISALYQQAHGRPAKKEELTAAFNFVCNGRF